MKIIPAIDIMNGKCVRLSKGDFSTRKIYDANPIELAKAFEDAGLQYLHLVDLDGARAGKVVNFKLLEKIAKNTSLFIDFGGGIKSDRDVKAALESGASQITAGSIALNLPSLFLKWLQKYGSEKIILGADARNRKIAVQGWQKESDREVVKFIADFVKLGVEYATCTDIALDGMLQGPSFELYNDIISETGVKLIASGGITTQNDLELLKQAGCNGAIIGKAIYENKISLNELKKIEDA
ncbi:MAG: 1-(5-phosphoribosyl)-5-[(5-phosphoribosylamino)methylideneamino]imidazole-4-carboxamide isomerase [Bacteroidota bacterium]